MQISKTKCVISNIKHKAPLAVAVLPSLPQKWSRHEKIPLGLGFFPLLRAGQTEQLAANERCKTSY